MAGAAPQFSAAADRTAETRSGFAAFAAPEASRPVPPTTAITAAAHSAFLISTPPPNDCVPLIELSLLARQCRCAGYENSRSECADGSPDRSTRDLDRRPVRSTRMIFRRYSK